MFLQQVTTANFRGIKDLCIVLDDDMTPIEIVNSLQHRIELRCVLALYY